MILEYCITSCTIHFSPSKSYKWCTCRTANDGVLHLRTSIYSKTCFVLVVNPPKTQLFLVYFSGWNHFGSNTTLYPHYASIVNVKSILISLHIMTNHISFWAPGWAPHLLPSTALQQWPTHTLGSGKDDYVVHLGEPEPGSQTLHNGACAQSVQYETATERPQSLPCGKVGGDQNYNNISQWCTSCHCKSMICTSSHNFIACIQTCDWMSQWSHAHWLNSSPCKYMTALNTFGKKNDFCFESSCAYTCTCIYKLYYMYMFRVFTCLTLECNFGHLYACH